MTKAIITSILFSCISLMVTPISAAEKIITFEGSTSGWMSTGICFKSGSNLTIAVSGTVKHSSWDGRYRGPDGNPNSFCGNGCKPYTNRCNVAALLAKVGSGNTRCVGTAISGSVKDSGELKFAINDTPTSDNEGSFQIAIRGGSFCGGGNSGGNTW